MKRFFLFFLVSVTLVGCSWDDPSTKLIEALQIEALEKQEQSVQPGIEFRSEFDAAPVVPGESAETPIYFKSNLEWKAETTSSWFSISPKSGKSGDGSVVIKTQANEEFDTRSGKITFTSGYKTFTITVVQSPKSAIILEKDSFEVGKDGGPVTVVAKTTVGFETVVPSDYSGWIGVEPYTKALETRYVQLNIAKNDGPERTGYVDLVNKEKGLSKRVSIKQDAGWIEVTDVTLKPATLEITVGDPDVKLVATVTPDNATDKTVNWASDKTDIATVDQEGNVHAVAEGTATITVTTTDGSKTATCAVTVKAALPAGALPGVFSVSATKKVCFSQGNLVATIDATGAPTAWKFATNQYDYIGEGGANKTIGKTAGDIDLFGWSTDATLNNWGIHTKISYMPDCTNYIDGNFKDWGTAIDSKGTWRTLSAEEWKYLFENHSYQWASVNGVNGYVIAPDGFAGTLADSYSDDAALSADNLVFLPAAGARSGSGVAGQGSDGNYWSSVESAYNTAFFVWLSSSLVQHSTLTRDLGSSVRLVTEVPAE